MNKSQKIILGIDYGLVNIGVSISEGTLAQPLASFKISTQQEAINKICKIVQEKKIDKIVVGISENRMGQKTKEFVSKLGKIIKHPIVLWDETLTSFEAREHLKTRGKSFKRTKAEEHKLAACLILQDYLDSCQ